MDQYETLGIGITHTGPSMQGQETLRLCLFLHKEGKYFVFHQYVIYYI